MKEGEQGFTLLEVLVVLTICGLATGLILTHTAWRSPKATVLSGQETLMRGLRFGRAQALQTGFPVDVEADCGAHHLLVRAYKGTFVQRGLPADLKCGRVSDNREDKNQNTPFKIIFFPDGRTTGLLVVLQSSTVKARVGVSAVTGRIVAQ